MEGGRAKQIARKMTADRVSVAGSNAPSKEHIEAVQNTFEAVSVGSEEAISALFAELDANGDGGLDQQELSDVISAYDGRPFNAEAFFKFYHSRDVADGTIDQKEFRWYVAHWALTLSGSGDMEDVEAGKKALPEVISDLSNCVDVYLKKEGTKTEGANQIL